jgi:uncharacterized protein
MRTIKTTIQALLVLLVVSPLLAHDIKETAVYERIKAGVDSVSAIDTHEHLHPFDQLKKRFGRGPDQDVNLWSLFNESYYNWINPLTPWPENNSFDTWWSKAQHDFKNAKATGFYRYLLPAFKDLYGVDFDTITQEQASDLNDRIVKHYKNDRWLEEIVTQRANIELLVVDPYWGRLDFSTHYPFSVALCNVTYLVRGFHASEFEIPAGDPYTFAKERGISVDSLDEYVSLLDKIVAEARRADAICLKSTLAYNRTLDFRKVPKERAALAFGKPRKDLTEDQIRDFEDFIMWRLVELGAKHAMPFQIHTGQARIQGSNPMLLVDLIQAHPKTQFVLFHGGYPWIGETGVIAMKYANVWVDSCWLPTISPTMAKRAFQEWLDVMPSNRIMWGADTGTAEGIYGAAEFTRRCLAEALTEKVISDGMREEDALRIGRQIMRENALELFPQLKKRLWRK